MLCSSACGRAGAHRGVVCSTRGGHLRAERRQPLHKDLLPPLVQPSRIEIFEEQLVRHAHVVERAFAVIPLLREYLGVGKLPRDFPDARFARLPLLGCVLLCSRNAALA